MKAAIVSIGDEVVLGQNLDTNSAWLSAQLAARSIMTTEHRTVADDREVIAHTIRELADRSDLVLITGGLGPTDDDMTRDALCDVLTPGQGMQTDEQAAKWLAEWFARHGRMMPPTNLRQAHRPATMRCLPNPHGTAPGLAGKYGHCLLFALPGPPPEMKPMFLDHVLPELAVDEHDEVIMTAFVHAFGIGESEAAQRLGDLAARDRHPLIGTTVSDSIITARLRAHGQPREVRAMLDRDIQQVEQAWGPYVFGRDATTLAEDVGRMLKCANKALVTAESCTGGWLGKMLVDVAGSSGFYHGGWITYTNDMKTKSLAVSHELLEAHGAVSHEVAQAMASGALANADDAHYALAISGIAGPDGGTPNKPVGTVFIALAKLEDELVSVSSRRFVFAGDRTQVRDRSTKAAMQMLRFTMMGVPDDTPMLWEVRREHAVAARDQL